MDYNSSVLRSNWGSDSLRGYKIIMEKPEQLKNIDQRLLEKADKLIHLGVGLWVRRNLTNRTTGEKSPGKLEFGWKILSVEPDGIATTYNVANSEIFHISIEELEKLNQIIFDSIE